MSLNQKENPAEKALERANESLKKNPPTQKEMCEIVMLPCLRAGYHQAICDFRKFFDELKNIPMEVDIKVSEKLIKMMTEKRAIEWDILREEQGAAIDEVIAKREDTPTDGR